MLTWQSVIFIFFAFLVIAWPGSVRNELFVLGVHNRTKMGLILMEQRSLSAGTHCWLLLVQLQSSDCPFIKLLFHSLVVLPVYNLTLLLIGSLHRWHLNKSASHRAERIVLVLDSVVQRLSLDPPEEATLTMLPILPPLPPPRCKRRLAPKPPVLPLSLVSPVQYPGEKDPFASVHDCCYQDQYKSLRRNLKRVLEGLQQPLPPQTVLPLTLAPPPALPSPLLNEELANSSYILGLDQPKSKTKSRKIFRTLFKRLGKPFVKKSSHIQDEMGPSNNNNNNNGTNRGVNAGGILHPIWRRFKFRSSRKTNFELSATSTSSDSASSNYSSSCLYSA